RSFGPIGQMSEPDTWPDDQVYKIGIGGPGLIVAGTQDQLLLDATLALADDALDDMAVITIDRTGCSIGESCNDLAAVEADRHLPGLQVDASDDRSCKLPSLS